MYPLWGDSRSVTNTARPKGRPHGAHAHEAEAEP